MAPASVGIDPFPNKKPKLVGSVILDDGDSDNIFEIHEILAAFGITTEDFSNSITINVTKTNAKVVITGVIIDTNAFGNVPRTFLITENGDTLQSLTLPDGLFPQLPRFMNLTISNPSIGNHTYVISSLGTLHAVYGWGITAQVIDIDDTHSTKNINLING